MKFQDLNKSEIFSVTLSTHEIIDALMRANLQGFMYRSYSNSYNRKVVPYITQSVSHMGNDIEIIAYVQTLEYDFKNPNQFQTKVWNVQNSRINQQNFELESLIVPCKCEDGEFHHIEHGGNGWVYKKLYNVVLGINSSSETITQIYFPNIYVSEKLPYEESKRVQMSFYDHLDKVSVEHYEALKEIYPVLRKWKTIYDFRHVILNMNNYDFEFMYGRKKAVW